MAPRIAGIRGRQVLDSRGRPTVEADVALDDGSLGRAISPSGASTGRHEAVELRDGDSAQYGGLGVRRAVENVNSRIAAELRERDPADQEAIDRRLIELDGSPDKSNLGANAILAVSLATARAAAASARRPLYRYLNPNADLLPLPMVNIISGGLHVAGHGRTPPGPNSEGLQPTLRGALSMQDFLAVPLTAKRFGDALSVVERIYRAVGVELERRGHPARLVADEGGYGPLLESNEAAIEVLVAGMERAGLRAGLDAGVAVDVAATHLYSGGDYAPAGAPLRSEEMVDLLQTWVKRWPIVSLEDPLAEDDWPGWELCTRRLPDHIQLVGDDLFVTNAERIRRGRRRGVANAVLIKLNQAGTLTETLEAMDAARASPSAPVGGHTGDSLGVVPGVVPDPRTFSAGGYATVVSARSGETEDTFIADLAVATGAGQIKIGSITRSERLAKYNQLLRIEEDLGDRARLARWPFTLDY